MELDNNPSPIVVNGQAPAFRRKLSLSRRQKRITLVLVLLVVVAAGLFAWLWSNRENISTETPVASVSIEPEGFTPATIKVKKGQDVAWTNSDEVAHEVYALQEDVPGLDSTELLATGDTYIYTFEEAGTFNYYDPLNPKLKGTVIVEE